ncbi:formylmethanofuran dehydrogenase subunit A, partial [Paraburkholderia sp. SIMBA_055]
MTLIRLKGGTVFDPANGIDGERRDLAIRDGRIVDVPANVPADSEYDATGMIVMAGGIDM